MQKGLIFSLFVLATFILSCNDEKQPPSDEKQPPSPSKSVPIQSKIKKPNDTTFVALASQINYPVLCISKAAIEAMFQPGVNKLVFEFNIDNGNYNPSLTVFKARANGTYMGGPVATLDRRALTFNLAGEIRLSNLELDRAKFEALLQSSRDFPDLLFFPDRSTDYPQNLTYKLQWGDCNNIGDVEGLLAADELNPSPPADPR